MDILIKIDLLFEQNMKALWTDFSKDKPTHRVKKITKQEKAGPKRTFEMWFPADTKTYKGKVRSRNVKMALFTLITQFPEVKYKEKVYSKDNYMELYNILDANGDFGAGLIHSKN